MVARASKDSEPSPSEELEKRIYELFELTERIPPGVMTSEVHFLRGNAFYEIKEYRSAVGAFTEAVQLDPRFAEAYNNRGRAFLSLVKNERAIEDFDEALRIKPDSSIAYNNRGATYWRIDNIGNAPPSIEDYNHAIKFDPKYVAPCINWGEPYADLGRHDGR